MTCASNLINFLTSFCVKHVTSLNPGATNMSTHERAAVVVLAVSLILRRDRVHKQHARAWEDKENKISFGRCDKWEAGESDEINFASN